MSKIVLITGCSTGFGRDPAERLTGSGYAVIATARKVETLENLQAALKLPLDVTCPESIRQAVDCALQQVGRIDVLVNNAGYAVRGAVEDVPVDQAQQMFDANVFGVMRMIQAVLPHMQRQEPGPEVVTGVVLQAMETAHPKARYLAGFPFSGRLVLRLGDAAWNPVVRQMFKASQPGEFTNGSVEN